MDIKSSIKPNASIEIRIGLTPGGIRHIKIVADSIESRDWAMGKVSKLLPAIELLESLAPPDSMEAPSDSGSK
jgi:hypothetical protein